MKYKAGDKVKIVSERTWYMTSDMSEYLGTIMTIFEANEGAFLPYEMEEDGGTRMWDDEMIEGIVSTATENTPDPIEEAPKTGGTVVIHWENGGKYSFDAAEIYVSAGGMSNNSASGICVNTTTCENIEQELN